MSGVEIGWPRQPLVFGPAGLGRRRRDSETQAGRRSDDVKTAAAVAQPGVVGAGMGRARGDGDASGGGSRTPGREREVVQAEPRQIEDGAGAAVLRGAGRAGNRDRVGAPGSRQEKAAEQRDERQGRRAAAAPR